MLSLKLRFILRLTIPSYRSNKPCFLHVEVCVFSCPIDSWECTSPLYSWLIWKYFDLFQVSFVSRWWHPWDTAWLESYYFHHIKDTSLEMVVWFNYFLVNCRIRFPELVKSQNLGEKMQFLLFKHQLTDLTFQWTIISCSSWALTRKLDNHVVEAV